jgi:hypothetical protein
MQKIAAIAPEDKKVIQNLLSALKPLNDLRGSIPLPYALTFLAVACEEGKPIGVYAREMDLHRFIMTRYIQCIGDRGRNGTRGLGLVTVKRIRGYPNTTEVFLTAKGRAVAAQVFRNLRRPSDMRA